MWSDCHEEEVPSSWIFSGPERGALGSLAQGSTAAPRLMPGTRLVRVWRGAQHEVHATEGGYIWRGESHASLSAIARAITGSRRNGPAFFGLRDSGRGA
ncbi:MAG TPA: DUF2924 domain-containing protein [Thermohalobaculum sp.]|nr:DUF2924 domain-containing protein [Thermohalobaculum sp.]